MYISELLCGVILGSFGTIVLMVATSLIYSHNKKNKE